MSTNLKIQRDFILHCQKNPEVFVKEVLGITLEEYQIKALREIAINDRIAIKACHDVGKSFLMSCVVLWFMSCFPGAKVITTAPTFNQVKNILWAEIRSNYSKSKFPLGGKMNLTEWQMTPEGDWFAIGFTPRNELVGESGQGSQSSFQGFHAPHVMLVFDEATGVPYNVWTMAEGILTSASVKFVAIGNPTSATVDFAKCFKSPEWTKISLNCFDSPNLIANGITDKDKLEKEINLVSSMNDESAQERLKSYKVVKGYLLSLKWVVSMGLPRKWGIDHPLFISKVLGDFPPESDDVLMPLSFVEKAMLRVYWPLPTDRKTLGVDVARFGSDSTIMTALHGKKQIGRKAMSKHSTTEVTGEVIAYNKELGPFDVIVVDGTGLGSGVVDQLNEAVNTGLLPRNTTIREVQFGAGVSCDNPDDDCKHVDCLRGKYVNLKARMFGLLSEDLKANDGLALMDEDVYLEELPTIQKRFDSKGRMLIESKDDFKKRTGRKSPDDADSLALANFGRYDEISVGSFSGEVGNGYAKPFASSLRSGRQW